MTTHPAPVERRHRLTTLLLNGYTLEWLQADGREKHYVCRWLEGTLEVVTPELGLHDRTAQALADAEAHGRGERVAYVEAVERVTDRVVRAIDSELGVERKPRTVPPMAGGLVGAINDVFAFHDDCEVPSLDAPGWPGADRAQLRYELVLEEFKEFEAALMVNDLEDCHARGKVQAMLSDLGSKAQIINVADAIADLIYVLIGTALEFGIPLERVWREVQRTNMAKVGPDGKVQRREDGKILKPEGWSPPDIEKAVFGPPRIKIDGMVLDSERHQP